MNNLILLVACLFIGMALRAARRMPESAPAALNSFIIHISLPALALLYIHGVRLDASLAFAAAMAWVLFGLAVAFFWAVGRALGLSRATTGALMLTGGLGNTSFIGLPMIETFYGKEGLAIGIVADQAGSFLVLSTLGIVVAGLYSSGAPKWRDILKKIVLFPPFIALLAALLLIPVDFPAWLTAVLQRLGDTLAPLALVSVGFQLRFGHLRGNGRNLAIGLGFKLLLAPLLIALLFAGLFGAKGYIAQVTLFEAAMPPMITGAIVAAEHELDPPLVAAMVGVGILFSFLTLCGWWWALRGV